MATFEEQMKKIAEKRKPKDDKESPSGELPDKDTNDSTGGKAG